MHPSYKRSSLPIGTISSPFHLLAPTDAANDTGFLRQAFILLFSSHLNVKHLLEKFSRVLTTSIEKCLSEISLVKVKASRPGMVLVNLSVNPRSIHSETILWLRA